MTDLRILRKNLGFTQRQLAECIGLSQSVLSRIESGEKSPSLRIALKIEQVLGSRPTFRTLNQKHVEVLKRIRAPRRKPPSRASPAL